MPMDWRNSLRLAGDLALLGILVTVGSVFVVTAGPAVATGSAAIAHLLDRGRWPAAAELWPILRGRLRLFWAGPAALAAITLVAMDVAALRRGAVPGGVPATVAVLTAAALAAGWAGLLAVRAGSAGSPSAGRPSAAPRSVAALVAATGVLFVAFLLVRLVHPVLVPVLAGFVLFALHVVARRFAPDARSDTRGTPHRAVS